ncbi:MAG: cytochrome P450 [Proteobacteria bacterium]|nr:cytochrome P450 [Pseudomonadota bacterium]
MSAIRTERPTVDFDHNSPEFSNDVAGQFRKLRETHPVAWSPHHGGYWILTRYEDVARAARDDETFSSERSSFDDPCSALTIPGPEVHRQIPIEYDPPQSLSIRKLTNSLLAPKAVEHLRPMIERIVEDCVDRVIESGECDLMLDIAVAVPATFTIEWLGMPSEYAERFQQVEHGMVSFPPGSPDFERAIALLPWKYAVIVEELEKRKREPRDDALSYLVTETMADGNRLSDDDALGVVSLLISGGLDTTASLAGQALMYLHRRPDDRDRLIADPELLPDATEEFLRFFCPVTALGRTVRKAVEVGGQKLEPGERVLLCWAAANRDPEVFENPDDVILDRFPNRHQSFGLGSHRCSGSHVARVQFAAMITQILERMPDYRIDEERSHTYPNQGVASGWAQLPTTFTSGPRLRN